MSRKRQVSYFYAEPLPRGFIVVQDQRKNYTIWNFLFDCFMLALTTGVWILWIFIREWRRR